ILNLSFEISQGIKAFGASSENNPLASRKAKPNFTKFNTEVNYRKALPKAMQVNLKIKTQVSSSRLTPQEEFSLGGIDSVRGYPSGDYLADNALQENLELLIPAFFIPARLKLPYSEDNLKKQTTLVLFCDYGWGEKRGPLPAEKKSTNLLSIGAGMRFNLFNQAVLRLEWGFPLGSNRSSSESGDSRFHFSVEFQDKIPAEIERIRELRKKKFALKEEKKLEKERKRRDIERKRKEKLVLRELEKQKSKKE
ncbi:MAG: BamA/TamA family outer membrane protein, partial [Candidatus Omnitrophica bacterium]|nr:BamA/TamA family outer membrane protein [Candidatus Omnitrophota bacterium]